MKVSFNDRLLITRGRPIGFDYLRIVLAFGVVVWHSFALAYGGEWARQALLNPVVKLPTVIIIPAFFALSGFLVSGSLERSKTLTTFVGLRVIRIIPALGVEIILSALVLGPLLTSLPLHEYFADHRLHVYFGNILGVIHYDLPGVFENNPIPAVVNGQLWTIKWELRCYIAIIILSLLGMYRNGIGIALVAIFAAPAAVLYMVAFQRFGFEVRNDVAIPGISLLVCFILGVTAYRFRNYIVWDLKIALLSLVAYVLLLLFVPFGAVFAAIPVTYLTLYIGLWDGKRNILVRTGDYSYGVYIYGFAIQQAIVSLGGWALHWWVVLPLTLVLAGCFAAFSWFVIEKPAMQLKRYLPLVDGANRYAFDKLGKPLLVARRWVAKRSA